MSNLTGKERLKLEKLFDMRGGYVLNLNNHTIGMLFTEEVGIVIHDEKYCSSGTSKANKVREFWRLENNHVVGKAIQALIDEAKNGEYSGEENEQKNEEEWQKLIEQCEEIAKRLISDQKNLHHLKQAASIFDSKQLQEQIKRIENSINEDPALSIGTAKEMIETCCKDILSARGKPIDGTPNISTLTKTTLKELKLLPDDISDKARGYEVIKRLLSNLGTIGINLATLRGLYGTGHGKDGKFAGLTPRHAKLAVGAASTLVIFLIDTHEETKHLVENN